MILEIMVLRLRSGEGMLGGEFRRVAGGFIDGQRLARAVCVPRKESTQRM